MLTGWIVVMTGRGVHRRRERRAFLRNNATKGEQQHVRESDSLADALSDQMGAAWEQAGEWMEEQAQVYNFSDTLGAWKNQLDYGLDQIGDVADQAEDEWGELTNGFWEDKDDDSEDGSDDNDDNDVSVAEKTDETNDATSDETAANTEPKPAEPTIDTANDNNDNNNNATPEKSEPSKIVPVNVTLLKPVENPSPKIIPVDANLLKPHNYKSKNTNNNNTPNNTTNNNHANQTNTTTAQN